MEDCTVGLELELDKLLNLRHPCIASPIGFVFPDVGLGMREESSIHATAFTEQQDINASISDQQKG
jgi:hypothetical protein